MEMPVIPVRRDTTEFPEELEPHFQALIEELRAYYNYHGITVRSAYADFDKRNLGWITYSQFLRKFPGPHGLPQQQMQLLVDRYTMPHSTDIRYVAFHNDIEGYSPNDGAAPLSSTRPHRKDINPYDENAAVSVDVDDVLSRLAVNYTRSRRRPLEYFRDYDKLRSSVINENRFIRSLSQSIEGSGSIQLTPVEMQSVVQRYRNSSDGNVRYLEFCTDVGAAIMQAKDGKILPLGETNLEMNPMAEVPKIGRNQLVQETNELSQGDEEQLQIVLDRLEQEVRSKRIDVYPLFRDLDRSFGYTKGVTKNQFQRLLHQLRLTVNQSELALIEAKFVNPATGHINYPAFIAEIDQVTSFKQGDQLGFDRTVLADRLDAINLHAAKETVVELGDPDEVLARIKKITLERRARVGEFLREHDKLRKGYISAERFRQGLGTSCPTLTAAEIECMVQWYSRGPIPTPIAWREFERDVDSVFTLPGLESNPSMRVPDLQDTARSLQAQVTRSAEARGMSEEDMSAAEGIMDKLRYQLQQTNTDIEGFLRDCDKHSRGHVNAKQFLQAFHFAKLLATDSEVELVGRYYEGERGVNYRQFMQELAPIEPVAELYSSRIDTVRAVETTKEETLLSDRNFEQVDTNVVMFRIKTNVAKHRISVGDFLRDFDRLHSGRMPETQFLRGLNMAKITLSPTESKALATKFKAPGQPGYVLWTKFVNEVESVFTTAGMHLNPTSEPIQFKTPVGIEIAAQERQVQRNRGPGSLEQQQQQQQHEQGTKIDTVDDELEEQLVQQVLHRFGETVRARRMDLKPNFQSYDRSRRGCVTRNQFTRVLLDLGLQIARDELAAIYDRYALQVGGVVDVHYRTLCADIENSALRITAQLTGTQMM